MKMRKVPAINGHRIIDIVFQIVLDDGEKKLFQVAPINYSKILWLLDLVQLPKGSWER